MPTLQSVSVIVGGGGGVWLCVVVCRFVQTVFNVA